jgi:tRNA(adenine34) deaminase
MNEAERFMYEALAEAALAADGGDVPVGCVLVKDGVVLARGHNHRQRLQDPVAHAEVLAIREAAQKLGSFRLIDVTAYVTLEPCPMCAGAAWLARVDRVVFGAWNEEYGAAGSLWDVVRDRRLNHRPEVVSGVLADECRALLDSFFAGRRVAD